MTPEELKAFVKEAKLQARIELLEGVLLAITFWPEVPEELKERIRKVLV